jgi:hypothetical protein
MTNSKARGNNIRQDRTNMQAGPGGRGGHRKRKGGSPEG